MKISVIITSKSNVQNVLRLTESLYMFKNELYEIILVDGGTPNIDDIANYSFSILNVVDGKGSSRGGGKNIGIMKATGDVLVFLDDDTKVTDKWLNELKRSLKHSDIVAGYSPNELNFNMNRVTIYHKGQDVTFPSCNIAYKKKVVDCIGLFNKDMVTAEDIDYNIRCVNEGYVIDYNPNMKVLHYHRHNLKGFIKQSFWNGYGRKQLFKVYPELSINIKTSFKQTIRMCFGLLGYIFGRWFL